jgi:hypothetical protein
MKLRTWLAVIVFLIAMTILIISILPETRVQQVVPMPPITLPTLTPASLLAAWSGC